jgi:FixJ family two-component response regulator
MVKVAENAELIEALQKAFSNSMNFAALNEKVIEHQNRLNTQSDKMRELEINNARREEIEKTIISKLEAIGNAVEEIRNKPSKRYDMIWGIVATAIITALVMYILKI